MRSGFHIPIIHVFAFASRILLLTQLIVGNRPLCLTIHGLVGS